MIGVMAKDSEKEIVREFFELFKTPWEFYQIGYPYDVVLSSGENPGNINAKLVIIYGSQENHFDYGHSIEISSHQNKGLLAYNDETYVPIYGGFLMFGGGKKAVIRNRETFEAAGIEIQIPASRYCSSPINRGDISPANRGTTDGGEGIASPGRDRVKGKILRIGFDLFYEVNFLLSYGQPAEYACIPTLEIHIAMLRDWILSAGIPLVEIPPVPAGYAFAACLTHDVDFSGIRNHIFDHTFFGFVYRATLGSFSGAFKGHISWGKMLKNLKAVLSLPFVYLGLAQDFLLQFDRYREIEGGLVSTFFIIPYKNRAGQDASGRVYKKRACRYDAAEIAPELKKLLADGCEMGVHGIDAWRDFGKGCEELERISRITGERDIGVRMHWLYYGDQSPRILEESGFAYDSTLGYNEAVGYRAGTVQIFRPPGTQRFLELPMHIQDTSLFYPSRMGLTENEAAPRVLGLFENSRKYGGVLTLSWHERSVGPERWWDDFYIWLLSELKKLNVWFGTGRGVVKWFNKRRSASFKKADFAQDKVSLRVSGSEDGKTPDLVLRVYNPGLLKVMDIPFAGGLDTTISL